jgi:2,4-dienoyl-CoA reductase (NADPH2)
MPVREFEKLLQPGNIGKLQTKNRMVRTAAGIDYLSSDFIVKEDQMLPLYEAWARGGVGLIILGGAVIGHPAGSIVPTNVRIDDDKFIPGYKKVTDVVHKYGVSILMQLHHGGAWRGVYNMLTGEQVQPFSSSGMTREELAIVGMDFGMPVREMTVAEIKRLITEFVDGAERARKAGFDGIELNVATCHLGNAFLSRAWNRRQDEYGVGSMENRARFTVEIVKGIKERLGKDFVVGALQNGAEFGIKNGLTPEESQEFARIFEKAGVDYIHVRSYGYGEYWDLHVPNSIFFPEPPRPLAKPLDGSRHGAGVAVPLAAGIKKAVSIPVITVGWIDPELGEKVLEEGRADFIGMQRRLIADPELPNKLTEGRKEDIAPCTACLSCFREVDHMSPVICRINGAIGGTQDYKIEKAEKVKKVLVVGGGPGGMEAARVAALRGHQVVLVEKESKLSGLIPLASIVKDAHLEDVEAIVRYLKRQITKLGVDIRLGTRFDPVLISQIQPDAVILASGGLPNVPEIPGIDSPNVFSVPKLYKMLKFFLKFFNPETIKKLSRIWMPIGKRVVILGGGLHGMEVAEFIIKTGRKVTIVAAEPTLADDRWSNLMNIRMMNWLVKKGTAVHTGVKIERITRKGLEITTREGEGITIEADTIIPTTDLLPDTSIARSLEGKVKEVYCVGDCKKNGLIINAVREGYSVARAL